MGGRWEGLWGVDGKVCAILFDVALYTVAAVPTYHSGESAVSARNREGTLIPGSTVIDKLTFKVTQSPFVITAVSCQEELTLLSAEGNA